MPTPTLKYDERMLSLREQAKQKLVPRSARRHSHTPSQHASAHDDSLISVRDYLLSSAANRETPGGRGFEDPCSRSTSERRQFQSRSLAAQVEAIERLFPHANNRSEDLTAGRPFSRDPVECKLHQQLTYQHRCPNHSTTTHDLLDAPAPPLPVATLLPSLHDVLNQKALKSQPCNAWSTTSTAGWSRTSCSPISEREERRGSLTRKPDVFDLRRASVAEPAQSLSSPAPQSIQIRLQMQSLPFDTPDLNKPLPPLPSRAAKEGAHDPSSTARPTCVRSLNQQKLNEHASTPRCTVDTTIYKRYLPAVTHETRIRQTHEVRAEQIVRETRNHHYQHRVQPIRDAEILPIRHWVPADDGGYEEIPEYDVPPALRPTNEQLFSSEAMSNLWSSEISRPPTSSAPSLSRPLDTIHEQPSLGCCDAEGPTQSDPLLVDSTSLGRDHSHSILLRIGSCGDQAWT